MSYKGYIPEKITYVCQSPTTEELTFDDTDEEIIISKFKVTPTFPVETGKKLDTAIRWTNLKNPRQITVDNTKPIKSVKVCNLEERGNGGRAYKVLVDETYYVDMREDVIMDTIFHCGIEKGGKLKGEYVWAKYGANLKLVRFGSDLHKVFLQGNELNALTEINKKDLVIGGIYKTKKGDQYLYLGEYYTYRLKWDEEYDRTVSYYRATKKVNFRFVKEKVYLIKRIWSFYYPKDNYLTCKPELHLDNIKETHSNFSTPKTIPKFLIKETQIDFSKVNILSILKNFIVNKINIRDKHKDIEYLHSDLLCLGLNTPEIDKSLESYNISISNK